MHEALAWAKDRVVRAVSTADKPAESAAIATFLDGSALAVASDFCPGFSGSEVTPGDDASANPPRFWIGRPE